MFGKRAAASWWVLDDGFNPTGERQSRIENLFPGTEKRTPAYLKRQPTRVIPPPESMDHMHLDLLARASVKGGHEKVDVMEIVELPALGDERVSQNVVEGDSVPVHVRRQVPDLGEPEGGLERVRRRRGLAGRWRVLRRCCQPAFLGGWADGMCEGRGDWFLACSITALVVAVPTAVTIGCCSSLARPIHPSPGTETAELGVVKSSRNIFHLTHKRDQNQSVGWAWRGCDAPSWCC